MPYEENRRHCFRTNKAAHKHTNDYFQAWTQYEYGLSDKPIELIKSRIINHNRVCENIQKSIKMLSESVFQARLIEWKAKQINRYKRIVKKTKNRPIDISARSKVKKVINSVQQKHVVKNFATYCALSTAPSIQCNMHGSCKIFWFVDSNCIIHKIMNIHPWSTLHSKANATREKSERGPSMVYRAVMRWLDFVFLRFYSIEILQSRFKLSLSRINTGNGVNCHCIFAKRIYGIHSFNM